MKKIISIILSICLILSACSILAFASWNYYSDTAVGLGYNYTRKWKDYGTFTVNKINYDFTYGYDTVAFYEDYIEYVHAQTNVSYYHYGKVKNDEGATEVTSQAVGLSKTDSAQVRHKNENATFYVYSRAINGN